MALDEDNHRLLIVTRRPPFVMVLDTNTGKEVARVPVGGSCEDVYCDAERKRIYAIGGEGFISVVQQHASLKPRRTDWRARTARVDPRL